MKEAPRTPALPQRELPPMRDLDPRVLSPRYVRPGAWQRTIIPCCQPPATIAAYPSPAAIAYLPGPKRSASNQGRAARQPRVVISRQPKNVPDGCLHQAAAVRKYAHIGGAVIRSAVHNAASAVGRLTPGQRLLAKAFREVGGRIYLSETALIEWLEWRLSGPHAGVSADDAVDAIPSIGMTPRHLTKMTRRAMDTGSHPLLAASVICSPPDSVGFRFDVEKLRVWVESR